MERLTILALVVAASIIGCSGPETAAAPPEPEKTAIAESKAAWDQNKVDAFKKAHADDGRATPGQKHSK